MRRATKPESYALLFVDGHLAAVVFTDPPYNIEIDGFAAGKSRHREFDAAAGERSDDEFDTFLARLLTAAIERLVDGGHLNCCMGAPGQNGVHKTDIVRISGFGPGTRVY